MQEFPPPVANPCNDCPWRRDAMAGWLGPFSAAKWLDIAHSESAIACHKTIKQVDGDGNGDWRNPEIRQCRGAAIFRSNVFKLPRNPSIVTGPPDVVAVFATNAEFRAHHETTTEVR